VNLVAGEEIATELMQKDLTGENLTSKLLALLDPATNRAMRQSLHEVAHKLGEPGASSRAAELIVKFLAANEHG
jgi:lipid A disaccharide synthetase